MDAIVSPLAGAVGRPNRIVRITRRTAAWRFATSSVPAMLHDTHGGGDASGGHTSQKRPGVAAVCGQRVRSSMECPMVGSNGSSGGFVEARDVRLADQWPVACSGMRRRTTSPGSAPGGRMPCSSGRSVARVAPPARIAHRGSGRRALADATAAELGHCHVCPWRPLLSRSSRCSADGAGTAGRRGSWSNVRGACAGMPRTRMGLSSAQSRARQGARLCGLDRPASLVRLAAGVVPPRARGGRGGWAPSARGSERGRDRLAARESRPAAAGR